MSFADKARVFFVVFFLLVFLGVNGVSEAVARECDLGVVEARFNRKIPELKTYVIAHNQKTDDCYMYAYDRRKKQGSLITMPLGSYCLPAGQAKPLSLKHLREELRNPAVEVNSRSWQEVRGLLGIASDRERFNKPFFQVAGSAKCNVYSIQEDFDKLMEIDKADHRYLVINYLPSEKTADVFIVFGDNEGAAYIRANIGPGCRFTDYKEILPPLKMRTVETPGIEFHFSNMLELTKLTPKILENMEKAKP